MKKTITLLVNVIWMSLVVASVLCAQEGGPDFSPKPDERQLPHAMHSAMDELPRLTVGKQDADIVGREPVLSAIAFPIQSLGMESGNPATGGSVDNPVMVGKCLNVR